MGRTCRRIQPAAGEFSIGAESLREIAWHTNCAAIFHAFGGIKRTEPELALNYDYFFRVALQQTKIVRPRAVPYDSYAEELAVLSGVTNWLVALSIL